MKVFKKAILPKGFLASASACGVKKSGKPDLALFYSALPAKATCLFTQNKIPAAPVRLAKKYLKKGGSFQAIIVNSGNANAFTGQPGLKDAEATAQAAAGILGIGKESVLVSSTGIIGKRLPMSKIKKAIPQLAEGLSAEGIDKAKKAILTTDTFTKEISVKFNLGKSEVALCGIAKGAGMIAPDMATMLAFIFTDAAITQVALEKALKSAADISFNCITVDGCMSTNDTVAILANGAAGNPLISEKEGFGVFPKALEIICLELARMIVWDAEGATKFIKISVSGAGSFAQAKQAGLAIANSNLFKAALYGQNPNFGRIVSALGSSGVAVREEDIKIKVSPLHKKEIDVAVSIGRGKGEATVYTSDLTPEYVKINAEYN